MKKVNGLRWFEAFAPSAQMFRGLGKGVGTGRGPRFAEVLASEATKGREARERDFAEAA